MPKIGGWKKHLPLLVVLLTIAGIIGICWCVHQYDKRQEQKAEEDRRRTEELVQGAEDLLAEHEALFERVAEVLTKQEVRAYFGDRSMKYVTSYLKRKGQGWTGNAITKVELARALS